MLSPTRLKEVVSYCPESGEFTRLDGRPCKLLETPTGYATIRIDGRQYLAHRLAWLYMTGDWPNVIDHIDHNKQNNAYRNLRNCSQSQNLANMRRKPSNNSGHKGVHRCPTTGKWRVQITCGYKRHNVGRFNSLEEAAVAYERLAKALFGEFASAG